MGGWEIREWEGYMWDLGGYEGEDVTYHGDMLHEIDPLLQTRLYIYL